jgi:hypothetical protein
VENAFSDVLEDAFIDVHSPDRELEREFSEGVKFANAIENFTVLQLAHNSLDLLTSGQ